MKIYGAERFVVGSLNDTRAVRIATCSPQNMNELEKGLTVLKKLYDGLKDNEPIHQLIV